LYEYPSADKFVEKQTNKNPITYDKEYVYNHLRLLHEQPVSMPGNIRSKQYSGVQSLSYLFNYVSNEL
jgi:hypothetical protein